MTELQISHSTLPPCEAAKHFAVALAQCFGCKQQLLKQSAVRPTNHGTKHLLLSIPLIRLLNFMFAYVSNKKTPN